MRIFEPKSCQKVQIMYKIARFQEIWGEFLMPPLKSQDSETLVLNLTHTICQDALFIKKSTK